MKVFMIGGTGLLGSEAAKCLIEKGHEVETLSLPSLPKGAEFPEEMKIVFGDINKMTDAEIEAQLKGVDVFVFAAGVDERVECPAPVEAFYYKYNIAPLERVFSACKRVGVKKAVVLGSYFAYLTKVRPDLQADSKHKYIRSRVLQEMVCENFADEDFAVCVLELPYIFGTQKGRKPVWTILIEQIEFMDKFPFTMYPKGGTAMLTCRQVGQVIAGACEKEYKGFNAVPIGMYNMKWDKFLSVVYKARGMDPQRKIVGVPAWMMQMGMVKAVKDYKKRGIDSGVNPMQLPHIMNYDLFIDNKYAIELGATEDDINSAIEDSIRVSVAAYEGKAELLGMLGEE